MREIFKLGFPPAQEKINPYLFEFALRNMRQLPFRPPDITPVLEDAQIISIDLANDRMCAEIRQIKKHEQGGLGKPDGPFAFTSPLTPPERETGNILDTSS